MHPARARSTPSPRRITALAAVATLIAGVAVTALAPIAHAAPPPLVSAQSGRCLDVNGNDPAPGASIQIWDCNGVAGQSWTLTAAGELRTFDGTRCLDALEWGTTAGTKLISWSCTGGANQKFARGANGSIVQQQSGLCVDVTSSLTANGTPVALWTCNGRDNQRWSTPVDPVTPPAGAWQAEKLDRGLISVRSGNGNLVQWRLLGTEPASTGFNVYRGATKIAGPITDSTNYLDVGAASSATYTVRAVVNGAEQAASGTSLTFGNGYLDVPISKPSGDYVANDASVGDLDGDGQLEIVLKWDPTNAKDNSQSGVTGNVFIDAYELDGTRLWRIDLGRNIRAGAHYTQFQVYDYDGDGKAEVAMKTADGTRSGTGQVIGNANADYRNSDGYVLTGPEYFTVFTGQTGAIGATTSYVPARGTVSSWGDSYGNRVDRFLAGTAYLDGQRPSIIMARGYYTRAVVVAWDYRGGQLIRRWTFDSNSSTSGNSTYAGQGNHALAVADIDQDGKQEIVYGAAAIDDDGRGLWNTRNGHGDAAHLGDLIPSRPGLEYYKVDEDGSKPASWMADARTGQILWSTPAAGDNGRGVSDDIWSGSAGAESWSSSDSQLRNTSGQAVARKPGSANFLAFWDGDTTRELLDGTHIDKYGTGGDTRLLTGSGVRSNNGTKSTPALSGDLFGDWREEVIWAKSDESGLRIYATPIPTTTRLWTLLHDQTYRVAVAWQNTAYNQPPHTGFFLGTPFTLPAQPTISTP